MESSKFYNSTTFTTTESEVSTQDTFMEEVETYLTYRIATLIGTYWFPILAPLGFVGNILSFLVMTKASNRKMSTCIYMAGISINDNLMMYMCFHYFVVAVLKVHPWHSFECKFIAFLALFALQNCTFLILSMTVDKYIAIKWPHKAASHSTPRRARIIVTCVYICVFTYNIPHFFISAIIGDQCLAYGVSSVFSKTYSWLSFVINAIIPFSSLIYMNYVIVKSVKASRKMFRTNETVSGTTKDHVMDKRQKTMKNAESQLTIMLLLVTTLFLILLFPTYFRFIYLTFAKRDTPLQYANSMLIYQVTSKLYITNSGVNFLLYCISGQKFRNDLKEILCLACGKNVEKYGSSHSEVTDVSTVSSKSGIVQ